MTAIPRLLVKRQMSHEEAKAKITEPVVEHEPNVQSPVLLEDEDGEPAGLVLRCEPDLMADLRRAAEGYPMTTTLRSNGVRNRSGVFGWVARNSVLLREGCRACSGAIREPGHHAVLAGAAGPLAAMLEAELPDLVAADRESASCVLPEWHMVGTQWTSGVLNRTSALPYHFDANNLPVWNAMVVMRRGTRGGYFHMPEWDVTLPCRDGDVCFLPAYRTLHGVTPIRRTQKDGYRYSAVYYTVSRMRQCASAKEEITRSQRTRSEREDNLIARQRASGLMADESS